MSGRTSAKAFADSRSSSVGIASDQSLPGILEGLPLALMMSITMWLAFLAMAAFELGWR